MDIEWKQRAYGRMEKEVQQPGRLVLEARKHRIKRTADNTQA